MKITNITEFNSSIYADIFSEYAEDRYKKELSINDIVNIIAVDYSYIEREVKRNSYIIKHIIDVEGVLFSVSGKQSITYLGDRGDQLGRLVLNDFIEVEMTPERAKVEEEIKSLRVKEEIERILEVIEIDKEDGFSSRKEFNVEKEVLEELRDKGFKIKNERWQDSITKKDKLISIISW